jgi:hypothetical protein
LGLPVARNTGVEFGHMFRLLVCYIRTYVAKRLCLAYTLREKLKANWVSTETKPPLTHPKTPASPTNQTHRPHLNKPHTKQTSTPPFSLKRHTRCIVEPEALASLKMNQYESLGVIETSDHKKLFHLVQRVIIALGDTMHTADEFNRDESQNEPKLHRVRKSNLERKNPQTTSRQSERLLKAKNVKPKVDEDMDACSSLSESVGASSSH